MIYLLDQRGNGGIHTVDMFAALTASIRSEGEVRRDRGVFSKVLGTLDEASRAGKVERLPDDAEREGKRQPHKSFSSVRGWVARRREAQQPGTV